MSLEDIRRKAGKFQRRIWWRNAREYAAVAVVVAVFGLYLAWFPSPVARAGSVLIITGALYVAYQLHRRAASQSAPTGGLEHCLGFHRRELERQRDALTNVWNWYLGPLVPGLALFIVGMVIAEPIPVPYRVLSGMVMFAVAGAVFWLVAKLNRYGARKLQMEIDELKALEK